MMIEYRMITWWYWLVTVAALAAHLFGWGPGIWLALVVTVLHAGHFLRRGAGFASFSVQVRLGYLLGLVLGLWAPLAFVLWLMFAGTVARLLFSYCPMARIVSLLPWNRQGPLTGRRVWRTITLPPVEGSILDALNAPDDSGTGAAPAASGRTA